MKIAPTMGPWPKKRPPSSLVHTGQHYDQVLSDDFFHDLDLPEPDYFLGVAFGEPRLADGRHPVGLEPLLRQERSRWIVPSSFPYPEGWDGRAGLRAADAIVERYGRALSARAALG